MDLINHFDVSGDVTGYINMHNPCIFTFGNKNCSTWVPLLKLQLKKINEWKHNRALGAKEGVPSEDATREYEKNLQHKNLEFIEDTQSWVGINIMSPIK